MKTQKVLAILCISMFLITALTAVPLLINYAGGTSPKIQLAVDLHVWAGTAFIVFATIRMVKNSRQFVKAMLKAGD